MRRLLMAAGLALAAIAATPASAAPQAIPQAEALDRLPVEYARHTREHREWEIQQNMARQHRRDSYRHGRGYDRGYGYGYRGGPGRGHDDGGPRGRGMPPYGQAPGYGNNGDFR
ncbi:DNA-directed RNA polymerase III 47 kDa polypeptide [Hyphomicrobiales bacterium]|nr:DNA-directed RNA polymerase III 47 kDa polypeptide [Hyphomicrobiales bacterium]CAH1698529.1 DNA-directed RNA polymerase III 47 kDa polypeptide [Hyphomicrobiales bacterium]CAI0342177.1 conserved exported hypothetical protein [Hyphomicrobiales bacterium]